MNEKRVHAIEAAALAVQRADDRLFQQIERARREGATWREIGELFGISRQAAQQRWS